MNKEAACTIYNKTVASVLILIDQQGRFSAYIRRFWSYSMYFTIQTIASLVSMKEQFIPSTYGTDRKGFESLPIVTEQQRQYVESVAVTTHGFGGSNTGVLIKNRKVKE